MVPENKAGLNFSERIALHTGLRTLLASIVHLPKRCNGAIPSDGLQDTGLNCLIHAVKTKQ